MDTFIPQTTHSCLWKAASEEYRVGFKRGELQQMLKSEMKSYFKLDNIFNIVPQQSLILFQYCQAQICRGKKTHNTFLFKFY